MKKLALIRITAAMCLAGAAFGLTGCGTADAGSSNRLGKEAIEAGNYKEAVMAFQQAISYDATKPEYYINEGLAYLYLDEEDSSANAVECFDAAIALDGENMEAYRGLGIARLRMGQYPEAIEAFDTAVSYTGMWVNTLDYDILEYRAEAELEAKDFDAAETTYTSLIELGYHEGDNYFRRGSVRLELCDREAALEDYEKAAELAGDDYSLYLDIYYSLCDYGLDSQASSYIDKALAIAGTDEEDYLARGEVFFQEGRYAEALDSLNHVVDLDEKGQLYLTRAACYSALEQYEDAAGQYDYYITKYGRDYRVLNELAACQCAQGLYGDAINSLKTAMAMDGAMDEPAIKWNLIIAYEDNGQPELAYAVAVEYAANYPDNEEAARELAYLEQTLGIAGVEPVAADPVTQ